jgi:hypothetical protein
MVQINLGSKKGRSIHFPVNRVPFTLHPPRGNFAGHVCCEVTEGSEGISIAGHEAFFAVLQVGQCSESVQL